MASPWRLLNQNPSDPELRPLLISTTFTSNAYTVNVTDLTYLWSESLDRRSIIKRSLDEDTSIDPSEDTEQLRVFLSKIASALSGAPKTRLALQTIPNRKPDTPANLDLYITVELPKPLAPLKWPIHLLLSPQSALSAQLTVPLLRAQNARMREMEALVEMLRDKDHVIQKLIDKLEATGAELGHVFPGAAGKGGRKVSRKVAEERVKGLGVFEVEVWKREMRRGEEDGGEDLEAVVKGVFGEDEGAAFVGADEAGTAAIGDKWWDKFKDDPVELSNATTAEESHKTHGNTSNSKHKGDSPPPEEDDDGFQIQATPPQAPGGSQTKPSSSTSSPTTLRSQAVISDSTDNEDDLDGGAMFVASQRSTQRSAVPDSFPSSPPKKTQAKKLGAIGRSKAASKRASTPPAKTRSHESPKKANAQEDQVVDDGDETATEDEDEDEDVHGPGKRVTPSKRATTPPQEKHSPAKAKKGGLGKIGGKKKDTTPPPDSPSPPASVAPASASPPLSSQPANGDTTVSEATILPERKPKHKLGVIGHRVAKTPEVEKEKSREEEAQGQPEEHKETEEERADRKREELKRELEEKARHPVKKKRRF